MWNGEERRQMKKELRSSEDAVKAISSAAESAVKAIAEAAGEARGVVTANAAEAAKVLLNKSSDGTSDHDFLLTFSTEVKTKLNSIAADIKELKDNTAGRINDLEAEKLNVKDSYLVLHKEANDKINADHETRLRAQETLANRIIGWGSAALVGVGILEFVLNKMIKI